MLFFAKIQVEKLQIFIVSIADNNIFITIHSVKTTIYSVCAHLFILALQLCCVKQN
jgi:hypothetical protein